jgi:hypothetical protein
MPYQLRDHHGLVCTITTEKLCEISILEHTVYLLTKGRAIVIVYNASA